MAKDKKYETTNPVFKEFLDGLKEANESMKKAIDKKNTKSKKMGGTVRKMNMGGVLKNRGGTYKGTY